MDKKLVLVMSTMNSTSDDILNIIHWNCSTACKTAVAAEDFGYYALLLADRANFKHVAI